MVVVVVVDVGDAYKHRAILRADDDINDLDRTPYQYFKLFHPTAHLDQTLRLTSAKLWRKGHLPLSMQEYFVFVALLVGSALYAKTTLLTLFNSVYDVEGLRVTPNFSKFMRYQRYNAISANLTFDDVEDASYCFWKVRPLVTAFNNLRKRFIIAGVVLCVDESFSWWDGADAGIRVEGMPHVTKLKEKPRGIGLMIKNVCESETMLTIELVADKDEMARREFTVELGSGTAYLLRLTKSQWGSGRIVVADSAFASVKSAVELKRKGLYFIGHVKTAHRKCPKKFMKEREYRRRGDHCVATSTVDGVPLRCVAWHEEKRKKNKITPKVYVGSCGATFPGRPHMKVRHKKVGARSIRYEVPVPRPQMIATYHEHCGKIDDHNQLGQGVLGLEYRRTTRWEFRFFQTFVRFCMVDAFLAHRAFAKPNPEIGLIEFVWAVLRGLINNVEGESANAGPLRPLVHDPVADGGQGNSSVVHLEQLLTEADYFRRKAHEAADT